jgi:hypothetical protein
MRSVSLKDVSQRLHQASRSIGADGLRGLLREPQRQALDEYFLKLHALAHGETRVQYTRDLSFQTTLRRALRGLNWSAPAFYDLLRRAGVDRSARGTCNRLLEKLWQAVAGTGPAGVGVEPATPAPAVFGVRWGPDERDLRTAAEATRRMAEAWQPSADELRRIRSLVPPDRHGAESEVVKWIRDSCASRKKFPHDPVALFESWLGSACGLRAWRRLLEQSVNSRSAASSVDAHLGRLLRGESPRTATARRAKPRKRRQQVRLLTGTTRKPGSRRGPH